MNNIYEILKNPIFTEKSARLKESFNKITIRVAIGAKKDQIKRALKKLLKIEAEKINTTVTRGKLKRVRKSFGKQSNWKKAIVTVKSGSNLDAFSETQE